MLDLTKMCYETERYSVKPLSLKYNSLSSSENFDRSLISSIVTSLTKAMLYYIVTCVYVVPVASKMLKWRSETTLRRNSYNITCYIDICVYYIIKSVCDNVALSRISAQQAYRAVSRDHYSRGTI